MGFLTTNKLLEGLIDHISGIDFSRFAIINTRKLDTYAIIEDKKYALLTDEKRIQLKKDIDWQINFYSEYAKEIDVIERIIRILQKIKTTHDNQEEIHNLFRILEKFKQLIKPKFSRSIINILEEQRKSLKKSGQAINFQDCNRFLKKEINKLEELIKWIQKSKLDNNAFFIPVKQKLFRFNPFTGKTREEKVESTTILEKSLALISCFLALFVMNCVSSMTRKEAIKIYPELKKEATKRQMGQIIYLNKKPYTFKQLLQKYKTEDLLFETKIEIDFEEATGVPIFGDFEADTLKFLYENLVEVYDSNFLKKFGVKRIVFVPGKNIWYESHKDRVVGLALWDGTIFLASDHKWILGTFFHEIAHAIHINLKDHFYLNQEWAPLHHDAFGYGKKHIMEEIAEMTANIITLKLFQKNPNFEKNPLLGSNPDIIRRKILLLEKYGFFPKKWNGKLLQESKGKTVSMN